MSFDFLLWALLGGLGLALLAGPLGSLMVWQRLAYFGDTLAHGALLGAAAGLWWQLGSGTAILLTGLLLALLLLVLERSRLLPVDTLLGILSHSALALGLVALALTPGARVNMEALLFGDLLTITPAEVAGIWGLAVVSLAALGRYWNPLLALTVQEDLARVEGIAVDALRTGHRLLLAAVVAVGIKAVGALLITALLIGVDRVKAREVLEPAYDDALGVTAAFNRNLLLPRAVWRAARSRWRSRQASSRHWRWVPGSAPPGGWIRRWGRRSWWPPASCLWRPWGVARGSRMARRPRA